MSEIKQNVKQTPKCIFQANSNVDANGERNSSVLVEFFDKRSPKRLNMRVS